MNEKITAHPQKEEREKVLKEIRQLENRKKILENKQRNEERRVRTRRLIERGAILEGIFPLAPDLSGAEVKAFLIALSHLPGAAELTANLPKSGDTPSRMGKAAGKIIGRIRPTGTIKEMWRFGGQRGQPTPTGRWNLPVDRSALTTAATSGRALIKSPLSIWGQPPAKWKSAASAPTRAK